MLFPGSQAAQRLYTEKRTPFELIGFTDSTGISLDTLSQITGVERVSPILLIDCQLTNGEKAANCQIDAVYRSYLNVNLTDGALFTDNTNMPYLVLNEAATKLFSEKNNDSKIGIQEEILLKSGDIATKAQVCGIYLDNSEIPHIYMSYEVARKLFGAQFTETSVALLLTNKGNVEEVSAALRKQKLSVSTNTDTSLAWKLLEQQTCQTFMVSTVLVVCSAILTREKIIQEKQCSRGELECLLMAGITNRSINSIIPLRIAVCEVICIVLCIIVAILTNNFYWLAIIILLLLTCIHYAITQIFK